MPPISFVGSSVGSPISTNSIAFNIPRRAKPGDRMIAFVHQDSNSVAKPAATGWVRTNVQAYTGQALQALYRTYADGDPGVVTFTTAAPSTYLHGLLCVWRGVDVARAEQQAAPAGVNPGTSIDLLTNTGNVIPYSLTEATQLIIGVLMAPSGGAITLPGLVAQRAQANVNGHNLVVWDLRPESVTSPAASAATFASQGVLSGRIVFYANPTPLPGSIRADVRGGIGFTPIGV